MSQPEHSLTFRELLSPGEVAKLLRVCGRTVYGYGTVGLLAFIVTPGGQRRYRTRSVRAFMEGRRG